MPPLSVGHLPQIRQWKVGMKIENLNRRICPLRFTAGVLREGRLGDGLFTATEIKIHPSAFILHPCSSGGRRYFPLRFASGMLRDPRWG